MPPVTEERRKELAKEAKALGEEGKASHSTHLDLLDHTNNNTNPMFAFRSCQTGQAKSPAVVLLL